MNESPKKKLVGQIIFGDAEFIMAIQNRISEAKEIGRSSAAIGLLEDPPWDSFFRLKCSGIKLFVMSN